MPLVRMLRSDAAPTVLMIIGCYAAWAIATVLLPDLSLTLSVVMAGVAIALHASLQHEALHGNPFRTQWLNDAMVAPALTLYVPYFRFRDTHLAHHKDADLTDPYDDPESHFLEPDRWDRLGPGMRAVLRFNNTLIGRVTIGPAVGMIGFAMNEVRSFCTGDPRVVRGWLWHLPALALVLVWVWASPMPFGAYCLAAYLGASLLKIRTFLEHRAHEASRARSVIIEDRGPLSWLFLNNNFHVVHHMNPTVPWHRLPALYEASKDRFLQINDGYRYASYGEVVRRYLFVRKDPVAHPLKPRLAEIPADRGATDQEAAAMPFSTPRG